MSSHRFNALNCVCACYYRVSYQMLQYGVPITRDSANIDPITIFKSIRLRVQTMKLSCAINRWPIRFPTLTYQQSSLAFARKVTISRYSVCTQSLEIMITLLLPHKDLSFKLRNLTQPNVLIVGFKLLADEIRGGVI